MRSALAFPFLLGLVAALGCGSTDTSSGGGSASGSPVLTLISPADGTCVEVPLDRPAGVPITLSTTGIVLKPPGDCAQIETCGHLVLYVGDAINNGGATPVIDVLSTPEAPLAGPIKVTIRLVNDTGADLLSASGGATTVSVDLIAQTSCGTGSGGTGGSATTTTTTGTGGSGGTSTTTGTGGSGGTSTTTGTGGTGGTSTTTGAGGSTTTDTSGAGGNTMTGTGGLSTTGTGTGTGTSTGTGTGGSSSTGT